ncbi:MAG: AMP-binding protein, partial [Gammaproteobacteria bacterium]
MEGTGQRREFIRAEAGTLTYGTLVNRVRQLTTHFRRLALDPGSRVVVSTHDDLALATIFLALLRNGLTAVILNPEARATELARLIEAADPAALFVDPAVADRMDPFQVIEQPVVRIDSPAEEPSRLGRFFRRSNDQRDESAYPAILDTLDATDPPEVVDPQSVAYILFTSGTTSQPKGVEITLRSLFAQMGTFVRHYRLDESTRLMNLLPLHHTDGLTQGVMVAACAQATLLRPLRIRVNRIGDILQACNDLQATHLVAVPSMLTLMLSLGEQFQDVFRSGCFNFVISTAAYLDEGTWRRFEDTFGTRVVNVYGLTETVCESLYCGPDDATRRIGTIGKPVDAEAKVVDEQGCEVAPGETGELVLRGPHIMRGYFRMPEETADVLKDGWFSTGDLATVDSEGFFQVVGRKKDVIISAGMNVYPEDVNAVLRAVPGIMDVATLGLPDEQWGERVVAAIVAEPDQSPSEEAIAEHFLANASPEKLPREMHFFDELPRGPAGKVVKADLRRLIEERREGRRASSTGGSLADRVLAVAAHAFKCRPESLSLASSPKTTDGWTSLAHVEFLMGLELEFEIKLTPEDIMRIDSLGEALAYVEI